MLTHIFIPTNGDIGEPVKHREYEPLPESVPIPEPSPEPEPVVEPAEPVKEPQPA